MRMSAVLKVAQKQYFNECSSFIYLCVSAKMANKEYDKTHKNNNKLDGIMVTADTLAHNAPLQRPLILSYAAMTHALNC